MKTVQEWLNELDTKRLIEEYLYVDPIKYDQYESYVVGAIKETAINRIRKYLERLRTIPVTKPDDGHQRLLYVHRIIKDGLDSQCFGMVHIDELLEKGSDAEDYAYEFTNQSEIMGFLVADTPLTLRYIYELMADVMNEASFFGFEQEGLAEELQTLEEATAEIKAGTAKLIPWSTVKADLEKTQGYRFDEECDDERDLHHKVIEAEMAYSKHSREKELIAIRSKLQSGNQKENMVGTET